MAKQIGQLVVVAALLVAATFVPGLSFTMAMATQAIVAAAVATAAGYLFRPKLGNLGLNDRGRMVRQPITSRKIVYGYQRVSGPIVFITSTNNDKYLHMVIALADHEIQGYGSFYLNDQEVAINTSTGFVTNAEYIKDGNPLVRIKRYLGTSSQTADSDLVSEVPEWTTNHRLQGIAYIYVRLEFNDKVFQQGIPNIAAAILGKKVYDYRTSTTIYSYNPAMVLADYLTSTRHGLGCDASEIDTASFIAAANVCDETVALAYTPSARAQSYLGISSSGGTYYERRYQAHGVIDTEKNPSQNIEELLTAMGGTLAYVGGKWTVKAAAYSAPSMTLTIDDLRGPISMQTKVSRNETFNAIKGLFINPDASWQPTDYAAITSATFEAEDGGQRIFVDLNLPFTASSSMAQRLAKIGLYRSRQEISLGLSCKLKAFDLKPGDTVRVTIDRYGFSSKIFEVVDWKLAVSNEEMGVDLQLRELSSAVFDWNAEESLFNEDNTNLPNAYGQPAALTNMTFSSAARINADGTTIPVTTISWTASSNVFVFSGGRIELQHRLNATTDWVLVQSVAGDADQIVIEGLIPGAGYDFRIRAVNINNIASEWTTLTNQIIAGDSVAPGAPSGLAATGAYKTIQLTWTNPTDKDWFQTIIYENTSNDRGSASEIARISSSSFSRSGLATSTTRYYWLKSIDYSGNISAFNATNGVSATTDAAAEAESVDIIFIRATSQPATPAPSSGVPTGWYSNVSDVPAGSGLIYSSVGTRTSLAGNFTWQLPIRIEGEDGTDGTNGTNGIDGTDGTDGLSIAEISIFRRSSIALTTPTGGSYNFGTGVITPPTNWSASVPVGTDPVYISRAVAAVTGTTGIDSTLTWSNPVVSFQNGVNGTNGTNGTDGKSRAELSIFIRSASSPGTPTGGSFNFGTSALTPPTGWSTSVPSGTDPVWSARSIVEITGTSGTVTPAWSSGFIVFQNGEKGDKGDQGDPGADGADGADGTNGTNGERGSKQIYISGRTSWSDAVADAAFTTAYGGKVLNDVATQYGTNFAQTRFWNGSSWVTITQAIDGNLLVSGTVGADKISVSDLSAISADIGDIDAGVIKGGSATNLTTGTGTYIDVDNGYFRFGNPSGSNLKWDGTTLSVSGNLIATANINTNAVTTASSAYTAAAVEATSDTTWTDAQSLSFTTSGERVFISVTSNIITGIQNPTGDDPFIYYPQARLIRGSTVLVDMGTVRGPFAISYSETPSSGTHTYKLQIRGEDTSDTNPDYPEFSQRSIFAIETKR